MYLPGTEQRFLDRQIKFLFFCRKRYISNVLVHVMAQHWLINSYPWR